MSQAQAIPAASADLMHAEIERQRVRITYEKDDSIKFISHQDEFRAWERALRRAELPVLYKRGFNPQPHIQFASPLGVGFSGNQELVDITFSPPLSLEELQARIVADLPPGLSVQSLSETPLKGPALQTLLIGADYSLTIFTGPHELVPDEVERRIGGFLESGEQWRTRERKGRTYRYNLRPLVLELEYCGYTPDVEEHSIFLRVQQREGATGRPDEVISALGLDAYARRLRRDRLYFADNPLDVVSFSQYPVVAKADISAASPEDKRPKRKRQKTRRPKGRSISDRAADETG